MRGFFVLDYQGGSRGCPHFVDGLIDEYMAAPWNDNGPESVSIYRRTERLHLRTKHRRIDFDFAEVNLLFIGSERLVATLEGMQCSVERRALRVFEGKVENTRKPYFVLRANDRLFAMDGKQSSFRVQRDPKTRAVKPHPLDPSKPSVINVFTLVIDPAATGGVDLFWSCEAKVYVVSDRLAARLDGLLCVRLTPTAEYVFPLTGRKIVDKG
jgi:hypothetical protein